jgi:signal recognition particle GTPase
MSEEQTKESRASYAATAEKAVEDITVAQMTAHELKKLIQSAFREALQEILADPDVGLELRPEFEERLRQATAYVAAGGHLLSMEDLTSQIEDASGV